MITEAFFFLLEHKLSTVWPAVTVLKPVLLLCVVLAPSCLLIKRRVSAAVWTAI